jgi:hypothetical protein
MINNLEKSFFDKNVKDIAAASNPETLRNIYKEMSGKTCRWETENEEIVEKIRELIREKHGNPAYLFDTDTFEGVLEFVSAHLYNERPPVVRAEVYRMILIVIKQDSDDTYKSWRTDELWKQLRLLVRARKMDKLYANIVV